MPISSLIDKQDNSEAIRDQVASILATETASQQALAVLDDQDPQPWKLRVYLERMNAWEQYQVDVEDDSPIVNVWLDSVNFSAQNGNTVQTQRGETLINIDCYALGESTEDDDGHIPGDLLAALGAQRAARLVRNILMASIYTYLGLTRGIVGRRWIDSIQTMQSEKHPQSVQQIGAARVALKVVHTETSPQYEGETLETITCGVKRRPDGLVYFTTEQE